MDRGGETDELEHRQMDFGRSQIASTKNGREPETDGPGGRETDGLAPETERQRKMDL